MLRFFYVTDLHGDRLKYEQAGNLCRTLGIKVLHFGADILPKGSGMLGEQKKFVKGFLKEFYQKCAEDGITVMASFGNDDAYSRKRFFREYTDLLDEKPVDIEGYTFSAYNYVPDYPFGLKTACKIDHDGWKSPAYISPAVEIGPKGFEKIPDVAAYFKDKGTIEADLKALKGGSKAIVAIHSPPQGVDLDVCLDGCRVGSKAIYDWIVKEQPLMVLSGHTHESLRCSGQWKAHIGDTLVLQPGQSEPSNELSYVVIEIDQGKVTLPLYSIEYCR